MQEIKKCMYLTRTQFYETHLSLVNCILPVKLTEREIQVLAAFMALEFPKDKESFRFSTPSRRVVKKAQKLSDGGLTNYISNLVNKGFLHRDHPGMDADIKILPSLLPSSDSQQDYKFRIINKDLIKHITNGSEDSRLTTNHRSLL